jgi:hypothetical protein
MPPHEKKYSPLWTTLRKQRLLAHPIPNKSTPRLTDNKMNYVHPVALKLKAQHLVYFQLLPLETSSSKPAGHGGEGSSESVRRGTGETPLNSTGAFTFSMHARASLSNGVASL